MATHNGFSAEAWAIYSDAVHSMERAQRQHAEALREVERLRAALEDIKLRYDDDGQFAARDMWRVAYETLDARRQGAEEG